MKIELLQAALLLFSLNSAFAASITFDDWTPGVSADGDYGDFRIETQVRVTDPGTLGSVLLDEHAKIDYYNGNLGVVARRRNTAFDFPDGNNPWNFLRISVEFDVPVSSFAVDISSFNYSTGFVYFGVDATGQYFDNYTSYPFDLQDIGYRTATGIAPTGGRIDGFYFTQVDHATIQLCMDNLSFSTVPEHGASALLFAMSCLGLGLFRKQRSSRICL